MAEDTKDRNASQGRRPRLKTQEHQLNHLAIEGAAWSPWDAEGLVHMVGRETICDLRWPGRNAAILAAGSGASRPRLRGQDAHATASKMLALRGCGAGLDRK